MIFFVLWRTTFLDFKKNFKFINWSEFFKFAYYLFYLAGGIINFYTNSFKESKIGLDAIRSQLLSNWAVFVSWWRIVTNLVWSLFHVERVLTPGQGGIPKLNALTLIICLGHKLFFIYSWTFVRVVKDSNKLWWFLSL